jgi:hypothetical protein
VAQSMLADWSNFYVIIGSAAGGLTGLTFVVIALAADSKRVVMTGLRAFVTPTIVHFGTVLALAAYLSVPRQSVLSLSIGFAAAGVAGLIYVGAVIARNMRVFSTQYVPVHEDWLWHVIVPAIVYGALLGMAFLSWHQFERSLYGVAAALVSLLFAGIRNAWDVAVWNSVKGPSDGP